MFTFTFLHLIGRPDFAHSYMLLGLALAKLQDVDNAIAAFDKAIDKAGVGADTALTLAAGHGWGAWTAPAAPATSTPLRRAWAAFTRGGRLCGHQHCL